MKEKIKKIAEVSCGPFIREIPQGKFYYLQIRDFDKENNKFLLSQPTIDIKDCPKHHLLNNGDIIFAARGIYNFSVVYKQGNNIALASSAFLVIRIKDKELVNPDYLCWYLNRDKSKAALQARAYGSAIPSISKKEVEDFEIEFPSLDIQNAIVEIDKLQQREKKIYNKIIELRNNLVDSQLNKVINK